MFNHILRPIWAIITQTFLGTPELKKKAGNAFVCLVLSLAFSAVTSWLSYPVYKAYASISMNPMDAILAGWTIAIIVAITMFMFDSTIGYFFCEKLKGLESILDPAFIGVIALLAVSIGAFDAWKGSTTGAEDRAKTAYVVQSFADASQGKAKPYADEIAEIDQQIKTLLSDEQKVMWQGKMTTPYKNVRMAEKLQKQRGEYVAMQMSEIEEMKAFHDTQNLSNQAGQDDAKGTLAGIAIALYILQIILAIPIASFDIACDQQDGKRDGVYAKKEATDSTDSTDNSLDLGQIVDALAERLKPNVQEFSAQQNPIGFATAHNRQSDQIGYKSPSQNGENGNSNTSQNGENGKLLNTILAKLEQLEKRKPNDGTLSINLQNGKRFSSTNQPAQKGPKRNGHRVEANESRVAILAAYNALQQEGKKPTQAAISEATGISRKTVGNHIRAMKKEGIIK